MYNFYHGIACGLINKNYLDYTVNWCGMLNFVAARTSRTKLA